MLAAWAAIGASRSERRKKQLHKIDISSPLILELHQLGSRNAPAQMLSRMFVATCSLIHSRKFDRQMMPTS
jgi:hypothetical protein